MQEPIAIYCVNDLSFASFAEAVAYAQTIRADVFEIATGLRRWTPAAVRALKGRHVIVNSDGTKREFSRLRRS